MVADRRIVDAGKAKNRRPAALRPERRKRLRVTIFALGRRHPQQARCRKTALSATPVPAYFFQSQPSVFILWIYFSFYFYMAILSMKSSVKTNAFFVLNSAFSVFIFLIINFHSLSIFASGATRFHL
jgi:hypothetical protein